MGAVDLTTARAPKDAGALPLPARIPDMETPAGQTRSALDSLMISNSQQIVCQERDLGPVARLEFAHDIANMNLDSAFAHFELVGDDLV